MELENFYINSNLGDLEKLIKKEKAKYFVKTVLATRQCSSKNRKIYNILPQLIGGSADLSGSNNTKTSNSNVINGKF